MIFEPERLWSHFIVSAACMNWVSETQIPRPAALGSAQDRAFSRCRQTRLQRCDPNTGNQAEGPP